MHFYYFQNHLQEYDVFFDYVKHSLKFHEIYFRQHDVKYDCCDLMVNLLIDMNLIDDWMILNLINKKMR